MNLDVANSLSKYPSIPTYHRMGDRGRLLDEVQMDMGAEYLITEKVNGTNARILVIGDDYLIGSREEWLYAKGDRVYNPALGIVDQLRSLAEEQIARSQGGVYCLYGEVYGGSLDGAKGYTKSRAMGFRLFDYWRLETDEWEQLLQLTPAQAAAWRDRGGQPFSYELSLVKDTIGLELVPTLPHRPLPKGLEETYAWLQEVIPTTQVGLDHAGQAEGVVVRTPDRRICKLRFEDYERTLSKPKHR